jgi:hypothetical protein
VCSRENRTAYDNWAVGVRAEKAAENRNHCMWVPAV